MNRYMPCTAVTGATRLAVNRAQCLTEACGLRQAGKDAQNQAQAAAARALQVGPGPCFASSVLGMDAAHSTRLFACGLKANLGILLVSMQSHSSRIA